MAGRFPHLTCLAFAAVLLGTGRQGYAQVEYRLSVGSSIGVANTSQPGQTAGVQTDCFLMARAGAQLSYAGRLAHHLAAYGFASTWWLRGSQGLALTHTLTLSSDIETSAATQITLGGSASLSQLSLVDTVGNADPLTVGARPAGTAEFAAFDAHEAFAWQIGGIWRLNQMLEGRLYYPVGDNPGRARSESLMHALGIARLWQRDQAGLRTRVGVLWIGQTAPVGLPLVPARQEEFAEALLGWRHDFTPSWTSDLAAGAFVLRASDADVRLTPAGSATLAYRNAGQEFEVGAARTVEPNVYVGAATERDLVGLTLGRVIGQWEALRLAAMADLEHDSTTSASGGPSPTANILVLQAGAHYQPGKIFMYSLEYTFRDQFASAAAPGSSPFYSFRRQMVMVTIDVHYPSTR